MTSIDAHLLSDVEAAFNDQDCEASSECTRPAIWWAHAPCGCRTRMCGTCHQVVLEIQALNPEKAGMQLGCAICSAPVVAEAIVFEAIR